MHADCVGTVLDPTGTPWSYSSMRTLCVFVQAQILEFGLAVHEKFVPQDMRPLHKKLVDQFFMMKSSLGIQVGT